jgi:hypothetical protein
MARFLIEVPHDPKPMECLTAIQLLQQSGSHFVTHADYGCMDGIHKGWLTVEVDSKDEARNMLPPVFRSRATVVQLNSFTVEEVDELIKRHQFKA